MRNEKWSSRKVRRVLCLFAVCAVLVTWIVISWSRHVANQRYLEKCEDAKEQLHYIAEQYIEALNNQDYETYVSLYSEDSKEYINNPDSMYEFLSSDMYDFSGTIDHNDFTFKILEFDEFDLRQSFEYLEFEEALDDGITAYVEFGNSEKTYRQKWNFECVMEDGEVKIFEDIWLSRSTWCSDDDSRND